MEAYRIVYYHPRRGVAAVSVAVYVYVCKSVCNTITFEGLDLESSFSVRLLVRLDGIRVKFLYEGHRVRVKVKVTGMKSAKIHIPKTSIGNNSGSIEDRAVKFACAAWSFGYDGYNGVAAIFVM